MESSASVDVAALMGGPGGGANSRRNAPFAPPPLIDQSNGSYTNMALVLQEFPDSRRASTKSRSAENVSTEVVGGLGVGAAGGEEGGSRGSMKRMVKQTSLPKPVMQSSVTGLAGRESDLDLIGYRITAA